MKNFLFIYLFITLSIVVNSCEEGFKDESSVFTLVLKEVTAVPSLTIDNTPDYTFSSNIAGYITYGGLCSSSTTVASQGNNTITLDPLSNGTYSDCTITVDTEGPWLIGSLTLSSFIVKDPTSPTITEVTAVTNPTNDSTPNYTFSSDQAGTITYGGSCSSVTTSAISGNTTITLISLSDDTYSDCTVTVTDTASNSVTLNMSSFTVDTTAPVVSSFTLSDYILKTDEIATVKLVFSEAVSSFSSVANITVFNGTLAAMTSTDNITWAGIFTPTDNNTQDWSNIFLLDTNYTDTVGNSGTAANTAIYMVDNIDPSVDNFTLSYTTLKAGDTAEVTLVFSEAVASFSSDADITADNGTLATMTSDNNIIWTGIFTPRTNTEEDNNTLSLTANSYTDIVGNTGPASQTANYVVDTRAPTVSSIVISSATGIQNNLLNVGDNVSVTATFSESVIVDNASGTPTLTLVVGGTNRTATYTSGSGNPPLVFQYTIQSGETDADGISIGANTLALNSGTIKDAAGNDATITHSAVDNNSKFQVKDW